MKAPYKKEVQLGYAALILVVFIFIIMFLSSDLEIDIEDIPDEDTSLYQGESNTLRELNDFGAQSCDFCVRNCKWTKAKGSEACRAECVPNEDCDPGLDVNLG